MNLDIAALPALGPLLPALSAIPVAALATAALAAGLGPSSRARWAWGAAALQGALACALLMAVGVAVAGDAAGAVFRADFLAALLMGLIGFVGLVILRFSARGLQGQRDARPFLRALLLTLAGAMAVVTTNHLLLLALAWVLTSLSLHRLLLFFGHRPAARLAAHKKFVASRVADAAMLLATGLLFVGTGTLRLDELAALPQPLPALAQAAVVLVALAALLKCAQLPLHGWLIQVMEAPTPVSALLHAGVVNLGGVVLMRMAPLVAEVPAAQGLLVVVGGTTAVVAALVMSTRISIKVALAWSTAAQMGFMLVQCGLGLWSMALLHLVAHSLYKAHAFLSAGGVVQRTRERWLLASPPAPSATATLGLGLAVLGALAGFAALAAPALASVPALVMAGVFALALVPMLQPGTGIGAWLRGAAGAAAMALLYLALQALLAAGPWPATPVPGALPLLAAALFVLLFVLQAVLAASPQGVLARRLHPWFYGGLFVDERLSAWLFRRWPPPAAARRAPDPLFDPVAGATP